MPRQKFNVTSRDPRKRHITDALRAKAFSETGRDGGRVTTVIEWKPVGGVHHYSGSVLEQRTLTGLGTFNVSHNHVFPDGVVPTEEPKEDEEVVALKRDATKAQVATLVRMATSQIKRAEGDVKRLRGCLRRRNSDEMYERVSSIIQDLRNLEWTMKALVPEQDESGELDGEGSEQGEGAENDEA